MRRMRSRGLRLARAGAAVLATAVLAAGCSSAPANTAGQAGVPQRHQIVALDNISTLRSLFNHDDGHTRLVLIFSPT